MVISSARGTFHFSSTSQLVVVSSIERDMDAVCHHHEWDEYEIGWMIFSGYLRPLCHHHDYKMNS